MFKLFHRFGWWFHFSRLWCVFTASPPAHSFICPHTTRFIHVVSTHKMEKRKRKEGNTKGKKFANRKCYRIDGYFATEPQTGWSTPSAKSIEGLFLINQFQNGLDTTTLPTVIYHQFPELRKVKYGPPFRTFKRYCVEAYLRKISSTAPTALEASIMSDSDDESISPPKSRFRGRQDAPSQTTTKVMRPLISGKQMETRNKQVHLPTYIIECAESYKLIVEVTANMNNEGANIEASVLKTNPSQIFLRWISTQHMASEQGVNQFFGSEASNDATVVAVRRTIVNHNGCLDSADQGAPPYNYMIVDLPQAVKPATQGWWIMGEMVPGSTLQDGMWITNFIKQDSDEGVVNRVQPQRASFNPQPATFNHGPDRTQ